MTPEQIITAQEQLITASATFSIHVGWWFLLMTIVFIALAAWGWSDYSTEGFGITFTTLAVLTGLIALVCLPTGYYDRSTAALQARAKLSNYRTYDVRIN